MAGRHLCLVNNYLLRLRVYYRISFIILWSWFFFLVPQMVGESQFSAPSILYVNLVIRLLHQCNAFFLFPDGVCFIRGYQSHVAWNKNDSSFDNRTWSGDSSVDLAYL